MPEFRRKVLDLVEAGRPVAEVAHDLGVSDQSIYTWRRQDRIDRGIEPGLTSSEKVELTQAKQRIAELETELRATQRAVELTREVVSHTREIRGRRRDGCRKHPRGPVLQGARCCRVGLLRVAIQPLDGLRQRVTLTARRSARRDTVGCWTLMAFAFAWSYSTRRPCRRASMLIRSSAWGCRLCEFARPWRSVQRRWCPPSVGRSSRCCSDDSLCWVARVLSAAGSRLIEFHYSTS